MRRIQFYAEEPLYERLNNIAQKRDISVSQLISQVLKNIDIEKTVSKPDGLSNQMAEILRAVAAYVDLCKQDATKPRRFTLRDAVPDFQMKYPPYIEHEGEKIRNTAGGRVGRQFYNLVTKGLVPNVTRTDTLDRNRTVIYEVVL